MGTKNTKVGECTSIFNNNIILNNYNINDIIIKLLRLRCISEKIWNIYLLSINHKNHSFLFFF